MKKKLEEIASRIRQEFPVLKTLLDHNRSVIGAWSAYEHELKTLLHLLFFYQLAIVFMMALSCLDMILSFQGHLGVVEQTRFTAVVAGIRMMVLLALFTLPSFLVFCYRWIYVVPNIKRFGEYFGLTVQISKSGKHHISFVGGIETDESDLRWYALECLIMQAQKIQACRDGEKAKTLKLDFYEGVNLANRFTDEVAGCTFEDFGEATLPLKIQSYIKYEEKYPRKWRWADANNSDEFNRNRSLVADYYRKNGEELKWEVSK